MQMQQRRRFVGKYNTNQMRRLPLEIVPSFLTEHLCETCANKLFLELSLVFAAGAELFYTPPTTKQLIR